LSLLEWLVAREREEPGTTISGRDLLPRASVLCSSDSTPWKAVARAAAELIQLECISWRYVLYPGESSIPAPHLLNDRTLQQVEDIMVTTGGLTHLANVRLVGVETQITISGDQRAITRERVVVETSQAPLVFVSYSHDSREHQDWVRKVFVSGLIGRGVNARMDVHELSYGDRIDAFMEDFLGRCDHVAVICTPNYAERSAGDVGGVGYEKQLIRRFIDAVDPSRKVIPVLRAGDANAVPAYLGSRLYADMRSDENTAALLDEVATVLYGLRVHEAPPIAAPPAWLEKRLARRDEA
jgi:TIR domain